MPISPPMRRAPKARSASRPRPTTTLNACQASDTRAGVKRTKRYSSGRPSAIPATNAGISGRWLGAKGMATSAPRQASAHSPR